MSYYADAALFGKVEERVQKGVQFLDKNADKDWFDHVDTAKLNMAMLDYCVLGQLYGTYRNGLIALILVDINSVVRLGFDGEGEEMEALTVAWKNAISRKQSIQHVRFLGVGQLVGV